MIFSCVRPERLYVVPTGCSTLHRLLAPAGDVVAASHHFEWMSTAKSTYQLAITLGSTRYIKYFAGEFDHP